MRCGPAGGEYSLGMDEKREVTAMVGYPRTQLWGGPAAWGGLKFWKTLPGRYTMAEAYFLNQQHMLYTLNKFSPRLLKRLTTRIGMLPGIYLK